MFDRLESVTQSIRIFRKNEKGDLYPVEISKEKAWSYAPTSNDFSHLANEYLKSSSSLIQLNKESGESFGVVPAYLALHGLELTLKGALHSIDSDTYSIKELRRRNYGHNIINLHAEYHKHLDPLLDQFDDSKQKEIKAVFDDYASKGYEYLETNSSSLTVSFELIEDVVFKVANTIYFHLQKHF